MSYNDYALNINTRSLKIDSDALNLKLNYLKEESKKPGISGFFGSFELDRLTNQLEFFKEGKNFAPKNGEDNDKYKRGYSFKDLVFDRHSAIAEGLSFCKYTHMYKINMFKHIDLIMSVAFNEPLEKVRENLKILIDSHNINLEYLGIYLMGDLSEKLGSKLIEIPLSELTYSCKGLHTFISTLIYNRINENKSMLSQLSNNDYTMLYPFDDARELATSVKLKLLITCNNILKEAVVSFYREKKAFASEGIVWSQDINSLILAMEGLPIPISYFDINMNKEIKLHQDIIW